MRKWIFPILRILIFTAIAVALVKVAFFPDAEPVNPDVPTAEIVEPQVEVVRGTVQNDVTVDGTVAADDAIPIKATLAGEVKKVFVAQGAAVDAGTPILTITAELVNANGTPYKKSVTVTSPSAGIVSSLTALVGQMYAVGDDIGKVAPPTYHVSGSLAPEQLYRLTQQPTEAQVTITGGPAPFTCTGLTITSPLAGAEGSPSGPTVTCAIPAGVTVFPGLVGQIVIAGGIAADVLTVPITAVEGIAETGNVYFVLPDGTSEARPVTLGLNDGFTVELKDGVSEGDMVLLFVPGANAGDPGIDPATGLPIDGGCMTDMQGNTICTETMK